LLDRLYGHATRLRRRRAERHPEQRRTLARPVVSVGNLSVGGTGKTPVVAAIASWLVARGERPSILSRGYGRAVQADGVVVVSDAASVLASIDCAGDEPMMLARQVPGCAVCVSPDRYLAGTLAERSLGCTVHLLDDGFQHVGLQRDLDILVTTLGEIPGGRVLPAGRLREPLDAAARAHLLVVTGATPGAAASEAWTLGVSLACGAEQVLGEPIPVGKGASAEERRTGEVTLLAPEGTVLAVAGIANPQRFTASLTAAGHHVADSLFFPDHHRYDARDLLRIGEAMRRCGAAAVFTTDKDAVRLEPISDLPFPLFRVPLALRFDSDAVFSSVEAVLARRDQAAPAGARGGSA